MLSRRRPLCVLHVVDLRDEQALETLQRTAQVIAAEGLAQVLVALDDRSGADAALLPPLAAEVSSLQYSRLSLVGKVRALQLELEKLCCERAPYAVHLHGLAACLLGWQALKGSALEGRVLYSPHWTPSRLPWIGVVLGRVLQAGIAPLHRSAAVAASDPEAHALSKLLNRPAEVLPHAVSDVFFACSRKEEGRASIVADGSGAEARDLISRLCVLFNSREPRVRFSWLAGADRAARAKLQAANVQVLDLADDAGRAHELSRAWLFVRLSAREEAAHAVAQAMAAGLPSLVSDTLAHRALIRHGETGYICASERDLVERIVVLLRDGDERERLGAAARAEAEQRFTLKHFETAVLRAYGIPAGKPLGAAGIDLPAYAPASRARSAERVSSE